MILAVFLLAIDRGIKNVKAAKGRMGNDGEEVLKAMDEQTLRSSLLLRMLASGRCEELGDRDEHGV